MAEPIYSAPRNGILVDLWACGYWWNNCYWSASISKWVHHKLGAVSIVPTYWAEVPSHRKGKRYA